MGPESHLLGAVTQICAWTQASACMLHSSEGGNCSRVVTSQIVQSNDVVAPSGSSESEAKTALGRTVGAPGAAGLPILVYA
jgi:hypothetical protein